jgi:radical SAM protein with 4Fe4S-binding SPASM domain
MSDLGPRPRFLPIVPVSEPARRRLPLADAAREVDHKWRPIYAVWEITLACDLACRHCGSRAGKARPDELTTAECLDFVDQMYALGVKEVTLIGGEAYLREDWVDIIRRIRGHKMICTMTTGGRGLTLERAQAAKDAGLQSVSVSVDGLRAAHDQLRAVQGSYDSAFQAMANLKAVGIPFSINTQINRRNIREIEALYEILADAGMHSWQVQCTTAMGRAGDEPDMLLEPYQMLEVLPMVARLKRKADVRKIRMWPGNNIGYFGPYETELRGVFPGGHRGSCSAGKLTLGVEANGNIKGCPSLSTVEFTGGNIRDNSLVDVWERSTQLRFTRDQKVEDLRGFCRTCYYAEECKGGCNWTSHVLLGEIGDNPHCHHRAIELLANGERERIERIEKAPGLPFDHGKFAIIREAWPPAEFEAAKQLLATGEGWIKAE